MIKNIIFDLGGVLIDWNPRYLYQNVFQDKKEMDYFLSSVCSQEWNVKQDAGRTFAEATKELVIKFPKYKTEIELYYNKWTSMLGGEIKENVAFIKPLKENYKIYGLTNWSAEAFPTAQEIFPFLYEFEGIVVSGEEKLIKPDKRIYNVLLSRYDLNAPECLFIDDSKANVVAAEELGFKVIHYTNETDLKNELKQFSVI